MTKDCYSELVSDNPSPLPAVELPPEQPKVSLASWMRRIERDIPEAFTDKNELSTGGKFDDTTKRVARTAIKALFGWLAADERANAAENRANHDPMTKLLNKEAWENLFVFEAQNLDPNTKLGVLFIDLTNLKKLNDLASHQIADEAIIGISKLFKRKGEWAGRLGGDEFGIIVKRAVQPENEQRNDDLSDGDWLEAERQRIISGSEAFCRRVKDNEHGTLESFGFGVAVGASVYEPGTDPKTTLDAAEESMKEHKAVQHQEYGGAYRPSTSQTS